MAEHGFHEGELSVQRRAGVRREAARLEGMLEQTELSTGIARFLSGRTYAAISARDGAGRLWVSPLGGQPGFLEVAGATTLHLHSVPRPGDPLHGLAAGQQVGLLVLEYAIRRRLRINGTLVAADRDGLSVEVAEAYGNCPQYIPARELVAVPPADPDVPHEPRVRLSETDRALVARADTFVLGTTHGTRGNDASHRGGPAGFVQVESSEHSDVLAWPDFPGNNLFNSLGNLATDPTAALLFADFATGATLHLSGTAEVVWAEPGRHGDADTGRVVLLHPELAVSGAPLPIRLTA